MYYYVFMLYIVIYYVDTYLHNMVQSKFQFLWINECLYYLMLVTESSLGICVFPQCNRDHERYGQRSSGVKDTIGEQLNDWADEQSVSIYIIVTEHIMEFSDFLSKSCSTCFSLKYVYKAVKPHVSPCIVLLLSSIN